MGSASRKLDARRKQTACSRFEPWKKPTTRASKRKKWSSAGKLRKRYNVAKLQKKLGSSARKMSAVVARKRKKQKNGIVWLTKISDPRRRKQFTGKRSVNARKMSSAGRQRRK